MATAESRFGALLRRYRIAAGLTQEELAERAGVSVRGISDLERGARGLPRKDTLQLLLEALDLSPGDRSALVAAARRAPAKASSRASTPGHSRPPVPLTPLIGREAEIIAVSALLDEATVRLLTLTGPGGTGKTRLALAVAELLTPEFSDGALFIDLAPLRDPEHVLPAIAATLGLREPPGYHLSESARRYLVSRHCLLVLDNFEHLLAAAPVVLDILSSGSRVTVLVTSREPLRLRGEREYPVPTFLLPTAQNVSNPDALALNEAVAFFVDRAQAVQPDFVLSGENAPAVAEICHRLDGLPLALELSAARVKHLPPSALLTRLDTRLPLLTGGARDAPERQRTLRNAIAWSYELLSESERIIFRRLGVFVGGWTLEAAEAVANINGDKDVLEGLASLTDKSLVRLDDSSPEPRYRMLETIREFAVEQMATTDDAMRAPDVHARYILAFAERFEQAMFSTERGEWLIRMEAEMPNLRAALAWLEQRGDTERLLMLAFRTWWAFWECGTTREAQEWIERGLALPAPISPEMRAMALAIAGLCARQHGDNEGAKHLAETALALSREHRAEFQSGIALHVLMLVYNQKRDYSRGLGLGKEAIAHFRRCGNRPWLSQALVDTGFNAWMSGDMEHAAALQKEGFALCGEVGHMWGIAVSLSDMGGLAEAHGDLESARKQYHNSLFLFNLIHDAVYIAHPLAGIASLVARDGQMELAARLLGATSFIHDMRGTTAWDHEQERDERVVGITQAALGEERFRDELALGRTLSIGDAVRLALDAAGALNYKEIGYSVGLPERAQYERARASSRAGVGEPAFAAAQEAGYSLTISQAVTEALALLEATAPRLQQAASPAINRLLDHNLTRRELEVL